jgi:hypothetical protein
MGIRECHLSGAFSFARGDHPVETGSPGDVPTPDPHWAFQITEYRLSDVCVLQIALQIAGNQFKVESTSGSCGDFLEREPSVDSAWHDVIMCVLIVHVVVLDGDIIWAICPRNVLPDRRASFLVRLLQLGGCTFLPGFPGFSARTT